MATMGSRIRGAVDRAAAHFGYERVSPSPQELKRQQLEEQRREREREKLEAQRRRQEAKDEIKDKLKLKKPSWMKKLEVLGAELSEKMAHLGHRASEVGAEQTQKVESMVTRMSSRIQELAQARQADPEWVELMQTRRIIREFESHHPIMDAPSQYAVQQAEQFRSVSEDYRIPPEAGGLRPTALSSHDPAQERSRARQPHDAFTMSPPQMLQAFNSTERPGIKGVTSVCESAMIQLTDGQITQGLRAGGPANVHSPNVEVFKERLDAWFAQTMTGPDGQVEPKNMIDIARMNMYTALSNGIATDDYTVGPGYREAVAAVQNLDPVVRMAVMDEIHGFTAPPTPDGPFPPGHTPAYSDRDFDSNPPQLTREVYEANYLPLKATDKDMQAIMSGQSFDEVGIGRNDPNVSAEMLFADQGHISHRDYIASQEFDPNHVRDFGARSVVAAEQFREAAQSATQRYAVFTAYHPDAPGMADYETPEEVRQAAMAMYDNPGTYASPENFAPSAQHQRDVQEHTMDMETSSDERDYDPDIDDDYEQAMEMEPGEPNDYHYGYSKPDTQIMPKSVYSEAENQQAADTIASWTREPEADEVEADFGTQELAYEPSVN